MAYREDELLQLSGIQHYAFCPRQWQLITLEQIWHDNHLTAEGTILHQKVDQPELSGRIGDLITLRHVPLVSYTLGLVGISDAVELTPPTSESPTGSYFRHPKYPGKWDATPIEYKRGRPKRHNADKLQLCAEVICLEEMYDISIPKAYLYYGATKHRLEVEMSGALRQETRRVAQLMHQHYATKQAVVPSYSPRCRSCSLVDECIPKVLSHKSAKQYLKKHEIYT